MGERCRLFRHRYPPGMRGFNPAARGQPGTNHPRPEIHVRDRGLVDPLEGDGSFARSDAGWRESRRFVPFHVKHKVVLVMSFGAGRESNFAGEQQGPYVDVLAGFLQKLPLQCVGSGLVRVDVPAWKIVIVSFDASACEDELAAAEQSSRNDLDLRGLCLHVPVG